MPTALSRATAFLWSDYTPETFFWEPLEMMRKIVLTGGVLLIPDGFEQGRVLLALLTSILFLTMHLVFKPLLRPEDESLVTVSLL